MASPDRSIVDFKDAQHLLDVSRSTLLRWLKDGRVTGYKTGRKWKFYEADLGRLMVRDDDPGLYQTDADAARALKDLRAAGVVSGIVRPADFAETLWCRWQDRLQWLWLSCESHNGGARLTMRHEARHRDETWAIPEPAARQVVAAWQRWAPDAARRPARPGQYTCIRGASGSPRHVLALAAHLDCVPPWHLLAPAGQRMTAPTEGDWLVAGPATRETAASAFSLARSLATRHSLGPHLVATSESACSYFWPGAVQVYDGSPAACAMGCDLLVVQLGTAEAMPARQPRAPRFRVAYMLGDNPDAQITVRHGSSRLVVRNPHPRPR